MNKLKVIILEERIVLDAALGVLLVTNNHDSGGGSLRDAVITSNSHPGQDQIVFSSNVQSINLLTPLNITGSVTIDGSNSSALGGKVALTGAGIDLLANNSVLKNLNISTNTANGIGVLVAGSNDTLANDVISGNYKGVDETGGSNTYTNDFIGTDFTGTTAVGNSFGLFLEGSGHDTISGNVISGNHTDFTLATPLTNPLDFNFQIYGGGIWIASNTAGYNTITNNHIGTSASGTTVIENGAGILSYAGNNLIQGNQISGAHATGVGGSAGNREVVMMPGADNNTITNNLFDGYVNQLGQYVLLPNGNDNVDLLSNNNLVQNNVMMGPNQGDAVGVIQFANAAVPSGNQILNNFMGMDPKGNQTNSEYGGVYLAQNSNTLIQGNQIAANKWGVLLNGHYGSGGNTNDTIQNNTINIAPGFVNGVWVNTWGVADFFDSNNTIKGNTIIGGNGSQDIVLVLSSNFTVTGNSIFNGIGVSTNANSNLTVANNYISGAALGILEANGSNSQILNNTIVNPTFAPYFSPPTGAPSQSNGIWLNNSSGATVSGNILLNTAGNSPTLGPAILVSGATGSLSNNLIAGFQVGLSLQKASKITSSQDSFLGNAVGVQLDSIDQLTMNKDLIVGLGKSSSTTSYGVQVNGGGDIVQISNSLISGATYGFWGNSFTNTITLTSNLFALDHYGIYDTSTAGDSMALSLNNFLADDFNQNF